MSQLTLHIDIRSYWHIGNGEEGGSYAHALALKDRDGLPFIPGKSLKGVLRNAFTKAVSLGWFEPGATSLLFGEEGREGARVEGVLQCSSAVLSSAEVAFFNDGADSLAKKAQLYRTVQSTQIKASGVAEPSSLRAIEVVVPMALNAELNLNPTHPDYAKALKVLDHNVANALTQVSTLISGIGAKRQRGYGEAILSVTTDSEAQQ